MGIFICNMRMQSSYDFRGEKLVLYSILSWVARSVWFTIPLWPFCYFRPVLYVISVISEGRISDTTSCNCNSSFTKFLPNDSCCASLPMRIMRRHEPFVSGKSIEHVDRKSIRIFLLEHKIVQKIWFVPWTDSNVDLSCANYIKYNTRINIIFY